MDFACFDGQIHPFQDDLVFFFKFDVQVLDFKHLYVPDVRRRSKRTQVGCHDPAKLFSRDRSGLKFEYGHSADHSSRSGELLDFAEVIAHSVMAEKRPYRALVQRMSRQKARSANVPGGEPGATHRMMRMPRCLPPITVTCAVKSARAERYAGQTPKPITVPRNTNVSGEADA
ncbi:hypothetical protein [Sedimentimonas flavescens]|uniref:hypothetical protein n=1 Tax=Sedimentimonas flavescens TaxID=2851012 RepID=UPI001C4A1469|nr:hypothetical protein [Sedimentimonas flavescens]